LVINRRKKFTRYKKLIDIITLWYIVCLIAITLFPIEIYWGDVPYMTNKNINLIPFKGFLITSLSSINLIFIYNIFGNLFLFTPIPILFQMKNNSHMLNYKNSFLYGIILSILIELLQYLEIIIFPTISRTIDITDIILNTFGFIIGHFIFETLLLIKLKNK